MNKRTRNFMVGSAAVVVFGLCTGLVAYYNGGLPLLSSSARAVSDMAYLPADAAMVGYADVRTVMDSEFRQKMMTLAQTGEGRDEFLQETGIDIERDIDSVMAGAAIGAKDGQGVILVRGRFNDGQIEGLILGKGGATENYKGVRMVVGRPAPYDDNGVARDLNDAQLRDDSMALAFLDTGFLAIGPEKDVKAAIDAKASGANAMANADLMKRVNALTGAHNAWAVGRLDAIRNVGELPEEVKAHLPAVQWFAVTANINGGIATSIKAEASDDAAAENLRDVVRGAMAMGRLVGGSDPKARMLLESLQMGGTGKEVVVTFSVSAEQVDALAGLASLGAAVTAGPNDKQ